MPRKLVYFVAAIWIRLDVPHQLKLPYEWMIWGKQSNVNNNMNNNGGAPNQLTSLGYSEIDIKQNGRLKLMNSLALQVTSNVESL